MQQIVMSNVRFSKYLIEFLTSDQITTQIVNRFLTDDLITTQLVNRLNRNLLFFVLFYVELIGHVRNYQV